MKIINYREYLSYLRQNYASNQSETIYNYAQDMLSCGPKQHAQKNKLQKEINILNLKINTLREEIKNTTNKKDISAKIKNLKQSKQQLVQKLKQHSQTTRFAMLSNESKTALCTLTVLRRYLTQELLQNDFHGIHKDQQGNIFFSKSLFERSVIYQDANHIKDFISAYIIQHPQKVLNEHYFNKFFGKHKNWIGIIDYIDHFFTEQYKKQGDQTRSEKIAESHKDIEIIKEYPVQNLVLVRLKTAEALDYEGKAAHNCVGGGSYDKLVSQRNSGIYSLRKICKDKLLQPIATIELNNGNIKQIQGNSNQIIAFEYCIPCRDTIMHLLGAKNIQSLIANTNISDNILKHIGIFRDTDNQYADLLDNNSNSIVIPELIINTNDISNYDWKNITINNLTISNPITQQNLHELQNFTQSRNIFLKKVENISWDLSAFSQLHTLRIISDTTSEIELYGQNNSLKGIKLDNIKLQNTSLDNFPSLSAFVCHGCDVSQINIPKELQCQFNNSTITTEQLKNNCNLTKVDDCLIPGKNKVVGEYLDLSGHSKTMHLDCIDFLDIKEIIFAEHIKETSFSYVSMPQNVQIKGLKKIDNLFLSNSSQFIDTINPQSIDCLEYHTPDPKEQYHLSKFTNLKKLTCNYYATPFIPSSVEELNLSLEGNLYFDQDQGKVFYTNKQPVPLDLSHLHSVKNLNINCIISNISSLSFPDNTETIRLRASINELTELDFSNCHNLKTLELCGLATKLNKITLPANIQNLSAPYSPVGFNVFTNGNHQRKKIDFILPSNSNSNIIKYLQENWGEDCIHLTSAQTIQLTPHSLPLGRSM